MATEEKSDSENIWVELLVEAQSSSQAKLPTYKTLLVLGDNESGKTSLIAKLQGATEVKKGSGLEFMHINVKDEYRDDQTRLGVWILDGDQDHRGLLRYALSEQNYEHTTAVLVASLARPWDVMDTLHKWVEVLDVHVNRLKIAKDVRQKQEAALLRQFQEYVSPDDASLQSSVRRPPAAGGGGGAVAPDVSGGDQPTVLPLDENTLKRNIGIPIVVVLTQSDSVATVEKDYEYRDEQWDFIQMHVRLFCQQYGASLVYTSAKEDKNIELVYRYLVHCIYGLPFNSPACIVEKEAIFIPTGWDSDKKIGILRESSLCTRFPDSAFNEVIVKPVAKKTSHKDAETITDEEQMFLLRIQSQLASMPAASTAASTAAGAVTAVGPAASRDSPLRNMSPTSAAVAKTSAARAGSANANKDPSKPGVGAANTDTGLLANFFNSLLTKKPVGATTSNDNGAAPASPAANAAPTNADRSSLGKDDSADLNKTSQQQQQQQGKSSPVAVDMQNNQATDSTA